VTRIGCLAFIALVGFSSHAKAESWFADLELIADKSTVLCTSFATDHRKLDLSGTVLTASYAAGGILFTAQVAPDGSVDAMVKIPAVSTLERLAGNAASRQLFLMNTLFSCTWKIVPVESGRTQ